MHAVNLALVVGLSAAYVPVVSAAPKASFVKTGERAPPFRLRTRDGALIRLDRIAYPGKEKRFAPKSAVVLDFFRTDCAPCIAALPKLKALHQSAGKNVRVFLVALLEQEGGEAKLDRFFEKNPVPFPILVDRSEHFSKRYLGNPVRLPATFFINQEGIVRGAHIGAEGDLQTALQTAFPHLNPKKDVAPQG